MRVVVLGATGMLGHQVAEHMINMYGRESVHLTYRDWDAHWKSSKDDPSRQMDFVFNAMTPEWSNIPRDADYVINCIGVIKPFVEKTGSVNTIMINSVFPHALANYCAHFGIKLIHITTDCVFSGKSGEYTEESEHDAIDLYGRSKSLGEPISKAMVLRTSIIGRELHKNASLVSWVVSQVGKTVNGYTDHLWNGITTQTYAECCRIIIDQGLWEKGLFHLHSPTFVTKANLVEMISNSLHLDVKVHRVLAPEPKNMVLSTLRPLCGQLEIPELQQQMKGL